MLAMPFIKDSYASRGISIWNELQRSSIVCAKEVPMISTATVSGTVQVESQ